MSVVQYVADNLLIVSGVPDSYTSETDGRRMLSTEGLVRSRTFARCVPRQLYVNTYIHVLSVNKGWGSLNNEILDLIFDLCPDSDLFSAATVNHRWSDIALNVLWSFVSSKIFNGLRPLHLTGTGTERGWVSLLDWSDEPHTLTARYISPSSTHLLHIIGSDS